MSTEDAGGWDLSNFKPVGEAPPAAATPAPVNGWDLSAFKPVGSPAASASPAVSADAARPSVAEQIANRPGPVAPGLPEGLQSEAQQRAAEPIMRSRTGQLYQTPVMGQVPILDAPYMGSQQIVHGVEQTAEPGLREKAGGAAKILGGAMQVAEPAMLASGLAAPVSVAVALTAGAAGQYGTAKALDALGVAPEYRDLASRVAGLLACAAAGSMRLTPEQTTLVDVLKGGDLPRNNTVDSLRTMVDRGGTINEQRVAQTILKNKYGIEYGPDLSAQAEAPAPAEPQPQTGRPPAKPTTPPVAPADTGDSLTNNPVENQIAAEEQAAIAKRAPAPPAVSDDTTHLK